MDQLLKTGPMVHNVILRWITIRAKEGETIVTEAMTMAMAASSLFSVVLPHTHSSPNLHFNNSRNSIFALSCSSPKSIPVTEQQVLQAIADSDGKNLPCVRTYENDLSQLTLVGTVDFQQALTASAADGGQVASDHIDAGMEAMVVETVFPAPSGDRATVSTRLVRSLSFSALRFVKSERER